MTKKPTKKFNKNFEISSLLIALCLGAAIIMVIYYMLGPSEGYLHSDDTDTISWAYGTLTSGGFFKENLNLPYLLPFGATSTFLPFVALFGYTRLAFRLSMFLFMLILSLAVYFMIRGMDNSRKMCFFTLSLCLITASSSGKLRELFWEHIIHYSLGTMLSFVLLAFVFAFLRDIINSDAGFKDALKTKKSVILIVCIALWSFFSAFDGLTTLALSSLPVICALLIEPVLNFKDKILSKENKPFLFTAILISAATILGTLIFTAASKNMNPAYGNAYSIISDRAEWSTNLLKFVDQWTSLLGAEYEIGASITSGKNILAAVKLAGSLIMVAVPFVVSPFFYKRLNRYEKTFIIYHFVMSGFVLYGYIFGNLSTVNWRLTPIVLSSLIINILIWKNIKATAPNNLKRWSALMSSLILLSCFITLCQIFAMPADYGRDNSHHKAIEFLEREGLTYGYATYWNANVLTLLSDSKVCVRDVNIDLDEPRRGWLNSDMLWYEDQPGQDKYFFLLSKSEYDSAAERNHVILREASNIISDSDWVVAVYDHNIF